MSSSAIALFRVRRNSGPFAASSPLIAATDLRRKLPTCKPGTACGYWKERKTPARALSHGFISRISSPLSSTLPCETSNSGWPMMMFAAVVFPLPFRPINA